MTRPGVSRLRRDLAKVSKATASTMITTDDDLVIVGRYF